MAKNLIKLYSLLLYPLAIIFSFLIGVSIAGLVEAGKDQMLAGGAIVLGYGVIAAFIGFCVALFIAYQGKRKTIIRLNAILFILSCLMIVYYNNDYKKRKAAREANQSTWYNSTTVTATFAANSDFNSSQSDVQVERSSSMNSAHENDNIDCGLGMFSPSLEGLQNLYFYGEINPEKSTDEHLPIDSISFQLDENGNISIATAPSWLMPEHLKLDYGFIIFKCKSLLKDFIEIEVNSINNQTSFVRRDSGDLQLWPEFLLGIHSVELKDELTQTVKHRPFSYSDNVKLDYSLMSPIKVQYNWLQVALLNNEYDKVGEGWVEWRSEKGLLLNYSLLS